jgi:general secretion pathway protein G
MRRPWAPLPRALLIFFSIFLMLAGSLLFVYKNFFCCSGDETKARTQIGTLQALIMQYSAKYKRPPGATEGLEALFAKGLTDDRSLLEDRWGKPIRYRTPGVRSGDTFDVYSTGHDGVDGTADDIGNWEVRAP